MNENRNIRETMRVARQEDREIRSSLRSAMDVQGPEQTLGQPWLPQAPENLFEPSIGGGNAEESSIAAPLATVPAPLWSPPNAVTALAAGKARTVQSCTTCGHVRFSDGPYQRHHDKLGNCTLEPRFRRSIKKQGARGMRQFGGGRCHCSGDEEHPGGCASITE